MTTSTYRSIPAAEALEQHLPWPGDLTSAEVGGGATIVYRLEDGIPVEPIVSTDAAEAMNEAHRRGQAELGPQRQACERAMTELARHLLELRHNYQDWQPVSDATVQAEVEAYMADAVAHVTAGDVDMPDPWQLGYQAGERDAFALAAHPASTDEDRARFAAGGPR